MPLKPYPTDPDKMVYVSRWYDIPQLQGVTTAQPEQEPQVCCGEYDTCLRACTPRGRHLAQPAQRTEQNFCPRCGKRTQDIHTCTPPPQENT